MNLGPVGKSFARGRVFSEIELNRADPKKAVTGEEFFLRPPETGVLRKKLRGAESFSAKPPNRAAGKKAVAPAEFFYRALQMGPF